MGGLTDLRTCPGCGIELQTGAPDRPGFVEEQKLADERTVCRRCYRIRHYNDVAGPAVAGDDFFRLLNRIGGEKALLVAMADIFDFDGSLIGGLNRIAGNNPFILVVNKLDLLPQTVGPGKLTDWIRRQLKAYDLKPKEIVLTSAVKNRGLERLIEAMARYREDRDVYVVGAANTGKSTLINRLIREYSDLETELTTSRYPGTTLGVVRIPLEDGGYITDTPGVLYGTRVSEMVHKAELAAILPNKPVKPAVYQLEEKQTLFIGALARFDFIRGERQSFTCYFSNTVPIHRTKLERADELYAQHRGKMLQPPREAYLDSLSEWTRHSFAVTGKQQDLYIAGLGWIKVNGDTGAYIDIHAPAGVRVISRDPMI